MEYRTLGRSGLRVSTLTFGTATFGGVGALAKWGASDVAEAKRMVDLCLDAGVNFVDTANAYSLGKSESILGEVLEDGRRHRVVVATKVRFPMGDGPNDQGLSRHHVISQCEASLRRLRTDHIDLYLMHEWDGLTPLDETMAAFDTLVRAGKVRYVGFSNFSGWQLMKLMEVARAHNYVVPVAQQIYYSLETRDAEYELIPAGIDQGIGTMVWSPLGGGLLSGKYRRDTQPESGRHLNDWHEPPDVDWERLYDIVDVLVSVAEEHAVAPSAVALAWLLGRPTVSTLVIGARTEEQLRANLGAADLVLSAEDKARLEKVSRPRLIYPYWHQNASAAARLGPADLALHAPFLADG